MERVLWSASAASCGTWVQDYGGLTWSKILLDLGFLYFGYITFFCSGCLSVFLVYHFLKFLMVQSDQWSAVFLVYHFCISVISLFKVLFGSVSCCFSVFLPVSTQEGSCLYQPRKVHVWLGISVFWLYHFFCSDWFCLTCALFYFCYITFLVLFDFFCSGWFCLACALLYFCYITFLVLFDWCCAVWFLFPLYIIWI